jgi:hypothetical protein
MRATAFEIVDVFYDTAIWWQSARCDCRRAGPLWQDPDNSAQVRIFTPTNEIPFAGHPNIGTAFVLGRREDVFGRPTGKSLRF